MNHEFRTAENSSNGVKIYVYKVVKIYTKPLLLL